MRCPSPLVLVMLLLAAAVTLTGDHPLVTVVILDAIMLLTLFALMRVFSRVRFAGRIPHARWAAGIVAAVAFIGMLLAQPQTRATYTPDMFEDAGQIARSRGFYAVQTDDRGNRYAWTGQESALALRFLVHRPVTITVLMRSAAVAGGPDAPVRVEANGVAVGFLRPDPANPDFQPFTLRFIPPDRGGRATEIAFHATPFAPGKGDPRTLGTMVQRVSIDTSDAWAPITRRIGLLGALPMLALVALLLVAIARRSRAAWAGYGAVAACALGAGCALLLIALLLRVGVIAPATYFVWLTGCAFITVAFAVAALTLPFGYEGGTLIEWARPRLAGLAAPPIDLTRLRARWGARAESEEGGSGLSSLPPHPEGQAGKPATTRATLIQDLTLVFVLALGIRVVWLLIVPPWLAPDELDHYNYVEHIVEQGQIPRPPYLDYPEYSREYETSLEITHSGDLRATTAKTLQGLFVHFPVTYDYGPARAYSAPPADRLTSGGARAANYPPLYYLIAALPYRLFQGAPILARLFAVRGASALLGALSCIFAYLLGYELRRARRWGWALALCAALLPMYAFDTAIVNNDAAMDLCAAALIWLTVRGWRRERLSPALTAAIIAASGLLLLTKPTALPLLLLPLGLSATKALPWLRRIREGKRAVIRILTASIVGVAVLFEAALAFLFLGKSAPIALPLVSDSGDAGTAATTAVTHSFGAYLRYERGLGGGYAHRLFIETFWGNFGWLDVPLADRVFVPITIVCVLGLIGAAIQIILQAERRAMLLLLFGVIAAQVLFLFVIADYSQFRTTGKGLGLQGRYYFPVLLPFLFLLLSGWDHLCREHPAVLRLAPVAMLLLQLVALATMLSRYYGVAIG